MSADLTPDLTPERWRRIQEILSLADDCPPNTRTQAIRAACAADDQLLREVESFLAVEDKAELLEPPETARTGERIGPYRIERQLGEGGMGSVFLATRDDDQYRKQVAIKLLQWSGDPAMAARLRAERQLLANLEHPNIARLLDGGALPDGQPYLVMEFIDGIPAERYVADRHEGLRAVLELFLKICAAVQFAHLNLIVHRDIKASNILVTADGEPHLLDFGIARLTDGGSAATERTQPWQRMLTPASASPEQAEGGPITTASDVYALGVLLYSLLTGTPFYAGARNFAADPARAIRDYEPPLASLAAADPKTRKLLAGDLDNILRKASAKEPAARYRSAGELADDIRHYLEGRPIAARPASFGYVARKFARRNRALAVSLALLALAIAAGSAGTAWYAYRAHKAQTAAERRFEALHSFADSMIFEADDALVNIQGATAARAAILRRAVQYLDQLDSDAGDNPAVLRDLARAYDRLGRVQAAEGTAHLGGENALRSGRQLFAKGLAIRQRLASVNPSNIAAQRDVLDSLWNIATVQQSEGDLETARDTFSGMLADSAHLASAVPPNDRDTLHELSYFRAAVLTGLGSVVLGLGQVDRAIEFQRQGLAERMALLAERPEDKRPRRSVAISHNYLANALETAHQWEEATSHERQALEKILPMSEADPANGDLKSILSDLQLHLCRDLGWLKNFGEGSSHCRAALEILESRAAADPNDAEPRQDLAFGYSTMSGFEDTRGNVASALEWERKARTAFRPLAGEGESDLGTATDNAASLLHLAELEHRLGPKSDAQRDAAEALVAIARLKQRSPKSATIADLEARIAALR